MTINNQRQLPHTLQGLYELANDVRWTWNHASDQLWRTIDADSWQAHRNPYAILQTTTNSRFEMLAKDNFFLQQLKLVLDDRQRYLDREGWYQQRSAVSPLQKVAYFCMEYGLGEALPLYAGGLGILAGDYLKAASDLCVPVVAVGLLFDQGYFRQALDNNGWQQESYPSCDTASLPISPALSESGEWLNVTIELPGRLLLLRLWQVKIGHVCLYLLDSNHPQNSLADQGICNQLYPAQAETRFVQQLALGIGGWRALQTLSISVDICHLNEAHCAFAILERVKDTMRSHQLSFDAAMLVARAGNILTTHTPVAAAFESFPVEVVEKYITVYAKQFGLSPQQFIALGLMTSDDGEENFSPMNLALNGCIAVNAVSKSHREVMQRVLSPKYPRWPIEDIPVTEITNGIHVPSWDSPWADKLWTDAAGKERWLGDLSHLRQAIDQQTDERLWEFKCEERADLIDYVRKRFTDALIQRGGTEKEIMAAKNVLDPNVLTLGFARRFTEYKRPNLLLKDRSRFEKILVSRDRPVQIIIAGKAHPLDTQGKRFIQQWVDFSQQSSLCSHVVFLPDYDFALAQELVQGVDVWINTPRYPWEACGTSGMKVLANGGLNLSELDGWWAQAYKPEYGWAIGDRQVHTDPQWDDVEADQLYQCLEKEIIPEFYQRDSNGLPRHWLTRLRASMAALAPEYSSNRMVREYVEKLYIETSVRFHQRENNDAVINALIQWQQVMSNHWREIHWGEQYSITTETGFDIEVQVYLGGVPADSVRLELYAAPVQDQLAERIIMVKKSAIVGTIGGYLYYACVITTRPQWHYTPRVIGWHEQAIIPAECNNILWWGE